MFGKLFSLFAPTPPAKPCVPSGRRFYAIGDIHGRLDLLEGLLREIAADEAARGGPQGELIFLGDLINRGPQSAQVIERLMALKKERPNTRFLLGNHEEMLLGALARKREILRLFNRVGGRETLLSYGVSAEAYEAADFQDLEKLLCEQVPKSHQDFMNSFQNMIVEGDYIFVHAGIRPGIKLEDQKASDLRWIREDFLQSSQKQMKSILGNRIIVHGHTIFDNVEKNSFRIGLDTGAYASGLLTAMGFEEDRQWILQCRM